eukprot:s7188_g1.t1
MCTTHSTDCTAHPAFALQTNRRPSGLWPAAAAGASRAPWEEASFRKYFPDSTRFGFPQIGHVLRNSGTMTVMAAMGRAARAPTNRPCFEKLGDYDCDGCHGQGSKGFTSESEKSARWKDLRTEHIPELSCSSRFAGFRKQPLVGRTSDTPGRDRGARQRESRKRP